MPLNRLLPRERFLEKAGDGATRIDEIPDPASTQHELDPFGALEDVPRRSVPICSVSPKLDRYSFMQFMAAVDSVNPLPVPVPPVMLLDIVSKPAANSLLSSANAIQ